MKNKLVTIAVLFALSGTAYSAMVVSDPMSYTYMATQVKDSAISLSNQAKMLVEKGKELATQNQIFITTKEIWTTARETQQITMEAYDAVVSVYGIPEEYQRLTDREIASAERSPITYADRVFKKYGNGKDRDDEDYPLDPTETEDLIKEEVINTYSAGNGMYRVAARNQAKDKANLAAIVKSQRVRQEISQGSQGASIWANYGRLSKKVSSDLTPWEREGTRNEILLLQAQIALKQLELQAVYTEAVASVHYKAYKNTVSDEVIENSTKEKRVDYNGILERDYRNY